MKPQGPFSPGPENVEKRVPEDRPFPGAGSPVKGHRFPGRSLVLVVFLAVSARLLLVGLVRPSLFWDSGSYLDLARSILAEGFPPRVGLRPPGYPLFLLAAGGGGISLEAAVLLQRLLGVAAAVFVYLAARDLFHNRGLALAAAVLFSIMPDLLFMEVTIYSETLTLFLLALSIRLLVRLRERPLSLPGWGLAGSLLALACLTRPISILAAPFFGAAAFFLPGKAPGDAPPGGGFSPAFPGLPSFSLPCFSSWEE